MDFLKHAYDDGYAAGVNEMLMGLTPEERQEIYEAVWRTPNYRLTDEEIRRRKSKAMVGALTGAAVGGTGLGLLGRYAYPSLSKALRRLPTGANVPTKLTLPALVGLIGAGILGGGAIGHEVATEGPLPTTPEERLRDIQEGQSWQTRALNRLLPG